MRYRIDDRAPREPDRLHYDPAFGVVWPRVGDSAITAAWAVVLGLLAVALLAGAITHPIATQAPQFRVSRGL